MAGRLGSTGGRPQTARRDDDLESVVSFADGPTALRPTVKHAWTADQKVSLFSECRRAALPEL